MKQEVPPFPWVNNTSYPVSASFPADWRKPFQNLFFFFLQLRAEYTRLLIKQGWPRIRGCIIKIYVFLKLRTREDEIQHKQFTEQDHVKRKNHQKPRDIGCRRDMVGVLRYLGCYHSDVSLFYMSPLGQNKDQLMVTVVWEIWVHLKPRFYNK